MKPQFENRLCALQSNISSIEASNVLAREHLLFHVWQLKQILDSFTIGPLDLPAAHACVEYLYTQQLERERVSIPRTEFHCPCGYGFYGASASDPSMKKAWKDHQHSCKWIAE